MGKTGKNSADQRREQILDAGLALALKNGFRGTSMQALAVEAGIAKPTLYNHFSNKEAVFAAVAKRIFVQLKSQVEKNLAGRGDLSFRISSALTAKHKLIYFLIEGSPHSEEIYSEKSKIAAREIHEFEGWLQLQIALALSQSDREFPQNYAQLLIACSQGIVQKVSSGAQIGPAIRLMVEKMLA